jgi:hypothetical protein
MSLGDELSGLVGAIIESTHGKKSPPWGLPRSLVWRYVQKLAVCAHLTFNQALMLTIELNHDKKFDSNYAE